VGHFAISGQDRLARFKRDWTLKQTVEMAFWFLAVLVISLAPSLGMWTTKRAERGQPAWPARVRELEKNGITHGDLHEC